jgi:hypothetical protein
MSGLPRSVTEAAPVVAPLAALKPMSDTVARVNTDVKVELDSTGGAVDATTFRKIPDSIECLQETDESEVQVEPLHEVPVKRAHPVETRPVDVAKIVTLAEPVAARLVTIAALNDACDTVNAAVMLPNA